MNASLKVMLIFLLSVISMSLEAQINTSNLDSIPFTKAKKMSNLYEFKHPALPWARISQSTTKKVDKGEYKGRDAAKDFGADIAESLFGGFLNTSTSREMNWLIRGQIESEHEWLSWDVEIYCSGELHKEKVKVKDTDGSTSVSTTKTIIIDWESGASGFIMENEKTISQFIVIRRPRYDSLFYKANKDVFDEPKTSLKSVYKNEFYTTALNLDLNEYAVVGKFRDEKFVLIANGVSRNMWFFINDELVCVFQPDLDELMIRKKDRIMPYILVDSEVSEAELVDWYRLALASKYLSKAIQ
jgi:hypothetical protein